MSTMSPTQSSPSCKTYNIRSRVRSEKARNIRSMLPSPLVCVILAIVVIEADNLRRQPLSAISHNIDYRSVMVKCGPPHPSIGFANDVLKEMPLTSRSWSIRTEAIKTIASTTGPRRSIIGRLPGRTGQQRKCPDTPVACLD